MTPPPLNNRRGLVVKTQEMAALATPEPDQDGELILTNPQAILPWIWVPISLDIRWNPWVTWSWV